MTGHIVAMAKDAAPSVRDRLLQAAMCVFSVSGFNGSSVQDITDRAGVPKGSFYNHFDSKEALGAAAIEHFWEHKASKTLMVLEQDTIRPLVRLRTYFLHVATELEANGYHCGCFIGNMAAELSDHSTVISDRLCRIYARWTQRIADCLAQAQRDGDLRSGADPVVLATFALNAWEGALLRARVEKSSRPMQQFVDTLFALLLC